MALALKPLFETTESNVSQRARALARSDQLMLWKLLLRQANAANQIFRYIAFLLYIKMGAKFLAVIFVVL